MSTLASLMVVLGLDAGDFNKGVKAAEGGAGSLLGTLGKVAAPAAIGAAVVGGVKALAKGLKDCAAAAMEAEDIQADLNATLASTKGVSGMTAESVNAIATSLSEVTRFEDDAIVSGQSMLLTFTKIGADVFPQASEAMLNLSQKMGTDLSGSAQMLGKALNDPITGISALRRVGVTFTDSQEAMIKKLVETGDVAGAQKIILAELETEFGGLARAAGETTAGQFDILQNKLGNIKETVGTALLPALNSLMTALGPILIEVAGAFAGFLTTTLIPAIVSLAGWIKTDLAPALGVIFAWLAVHLPPAIQALAGFWNTTLLPALTAIWKFITEKLVPGFKSLIEFIGEKLEKGISVATTVFSAVASAVEKISSAIATVIGWIEKMVNKFASITLPDWLTPGSPTPLETGLWGIRDALRAVAQESGPLFGGGAQLALAGAGAAGGGARSVTNHYGFQVTVNAPGGDGQAVARATEDGVLRAGRAVGLW